MPPAPVDGYGLALVQTLLALVAVCGLAWAALRVASRGGFLRVRPRHITVLEHTSLGPRRALYLVRVGGRTLLLGASDASVSTLAELGPGDLDPDPAPIPPAPLPDPAPPA